MAAKTRIDPMHQFTVVPIVPLVDRKAAVVAVAVELNRPSNVIQVRPAVNRGSERLRRRQGKIA